MHLFWLLNAVRVELVTVGIDATAMIIDGKRYTLISGVVESASLSLMTVSFNYFIPPALVAEKGRQKLGHLRAVQCGPNENAD